MQTWILLSVKQNTNWGHWFFCFVWLFFFYYLKICWLNGLKDKEICKGVNSLSTGQVLLAAWVERLFVFFHNPVCNGHVLIFVQWKHALKYFHPNVAHFTIHDFKGDGSIKYSLMVKYAIKYRSRSDNSSSHRDSWVWYLGKRLNYRGTSVSMGWEKNDTLQGSCT